MLTEEKMNRINELARKSKITELSQIEKEEQTALRKEYMERFRESFKGQLERIKFIDKEEKV